MIGVTTPESVAVRLRAANATDVVIEYDTDLLMRTPQRSAPISVNAANDYTASITLSGLQPNTGHYYRHRL
jgi:phosphodiesterase/alkaline phosphatase D-like protein